LSYLLDTNALLWWLGEIAASPCGGPMRSLLTARIIFVSPVAVWEVAVKLADPGSSTCDGDLSPLFGMIRKSFVELPLRTNTRFAVRDLPLIHKDPFDRLLIAQALIEGLTIITSDDVFLRYGVRVVST
jgi:PIN domain nuclease of toxin-antitoxin system